MKNVPLFIALLSCVIFVPIVVAENRLEELIVISSRNPMPLRQVGASVSVVTQSDIELLGSLSLGDLLRNEVGIAVDNSGGAGKTTGLRIRGEESFRTLVMVDGMDISDPTAPQVSPQVQHVINSGGLGRIEVLRGPQGFIYGADAGGVINLFTRQERDGASAELSAEYGRYNSSNINAYIAAGDQSVDVYLSVAEQQTDGFNSRTVDLQNEQDGYDNTTVHGKLGLTISDELRAQLVVRNVDADAEFDGFDENDNHDQRSLFEQMSSRLSLDYQGKLMTSSVALSYADIERQSVVAADVVFATEGELKKAEYLGSALLSDGMQLLIGVDHEEEIIERELQRDLQRSQKGVFTELQATFEDSTTLTAGARYDDNDDFGSHTSVRATLAHVTPLNEAVDFKIRSSIGSGFRAPSLAEIAYNEGPFAFGQAAATFLSEENSSGYDVGFEFFTTEGAEIGLTYFNQQIENEIFFDLINFSGYLQADGKSSAEGIELYLDYPINPLISLKSNATFNKTETTEALPRIRRPEKVANIGAEFRLVNSDLVVFVNLRVVRDAVNEIFGLGRVDLDDYEVLNITANYQLTPQVAIFARIDNAADADYEEVTTYNTAGASAYGGIRLTF